MTYSSAPRAMPDPLLAKLAAAIAVVTVLLLTLGGANQRLSARHKRAALVVLALASVATHFQFFELGRPGFYHRWEMFHYFVGSRYAPELGYERLYLCTAVADAENGHRAQVSRRRTRDLRDDTLVSGASMLERADECRAHFTPERWQAFRQDIAWFRDSAGGGRWWDAMQTDHGYNPSPVWTFGGRALTSLAPATRQFMVLLAWIDPVLMLTTVLALAWAFSWEIALLAAIFWGTQAPAVFAWTGGGLLRQDWLLLSTLALCFVRKRWLLAGGFALAWSASLRLFPLLLFGGPLVVVLSTLIRKRRIVKDHRRFLAGAAVGVALLLPLGASVSGPGAYVDFWHHISMHAKTPVANHMSLKTLFSYDRSARLSEARASARTDPLEPWTAARRARFARLSPWYYLAVALLSFGFIAALWKIRSLWIAMALSLLLVPTLTDPSCYYYSVWILAVPLVRVRQSLASALIGVAGAGQLLMLSLGNPEDRYLALAGLYLFASAVLVCMFARKPRIFAMLGP